MMHRPLTLAEAQARLDSLARPPVAEAVPLAAAVGRVLAANLHAPGPLPPADRALVDGWALRADDTVGASAYSPLFAQALAVGAAVLPGTAAPLSAGDPLPPGADAVLPLHLVQEAGGMLELLGPVAPGQHVERAGQDCAAGSVLIPGGRRLRSMDTALAAAMGLDRLQATRQPRIRLVPIGRGGGVDLAGRLYPDLITRDGGVADPVADRAADPRQALTAPGADLILLVGGTSPGAPRGAVLLRELGRLDWHGLALDPGEAAGAGLVGDTPAILLPGGPAAGWSAYEMLAGRLIRRLAGLPPGLPHPVMPVPLAVKLVGEVGATRLVPVRLSPQGAVPLPPCPGLAQLVRADGFVLVPPHVEGWPAGTEVAVRLFDCFGTRDADH
ncbi:molybdopterin molybdotransferase MoeA [Aerophototrophica crusticola]|uniref:Molybdopterin molybdenumtransferase n=1 Tax=Aerophototrophica crusticola TaxID=1709002 RepID=A0A858R7T8_9PROT|nr:molybdopterin molybdotransferase MoeA [Rhodospirillaceae bacterium B3]